MKRKKSILITGAVGFIGYHLCKNLDEKKYNIIGIDNFDNYYDLKLKKARYNNIKSKIKFYKVNICNYNKLNEIFRKHKPDIVFNLAAQAGVRYSIINPKKYLNTNIDGFFNIIELSRKFKIKHFIYASSSSIYGFNNTPFSEKDASGHPLSFYAATKRSNELIAHSYSYLYDLPCTGIRYFTVYGPWGRPDMSLFKFVNNIIKGKKIVIYNKGKMFRDFTYIDDAIIATLSLINKIPKSKKIMNVSDQSLSKAKWEIYNVGNNKPINVLNFIKLIEKILGKKAKYKFLNNQRSEMYKTAASNKKLIKYIRKTKKTDITSGIKKFLAWYKNFYKIN